MMIWGNAKRTRFLPVSATPVSVGAKGQQVYRFVSVGLWTVTRAVPTTDEMSGTWFGLGCKRHMEHGCRVARRWPDLQPRAGKALLRVV